MMNVVAALLLAGMGVGVHRPAPYDERADARREIARMLECARVEQKPLLLTFGANWCPWCRELDRVLTTNTRLAKETDEAFLRLNVDIGEYDRNQDLAVEYG